MESSGTPEVLTPYSYQSGIHSRGHNTRVKAASVGLRSRKRLDNLDLVVYSETFPFICGHVDGITLGSCYLVDGDEEDAVYLQSLKGDWKTSSSKGICQHLLQQDTVKRTCMLLTGTMDWIAKIFSQYLDSIIDHIEVLIITHTIRQNKIQASWKNAFRWSRWKHEAIGGVSKGSALLGRNFGNEQFAQWIASESRSRFKRELVDIILPASKGGCAVEGKPLDKLASLLSLKENPARHFVVPSVYTRTGWTSRPLTLKEIGGIYDGNELTIRDLGNRLGEENLVGRLVDGLPGKFFQLGKRWIETYYANEAFQASRENVQHLDASLQVDSVPNTKRRKDEIIPAGNMSVAGTQRVNLLIDPTNDLSGQTVEAELNYLQSYGQKAAKNDDAAVPVHLWNAALFKFGLRDEVYYPAKRDVALAVLREKFALPIYRKRTYESFVRYLTNEYGREWRSKLKLLREIDINRKPSDQELTLYELKLDLLSGLEGILRIYRGSWWEWNFGSTPFFWRWPKESRKQVRDGYPVYVEGKLPKYRKIQRLPKEQYMINRMKEKVGSICARGYLEKGYVQSLINCFAVPKGESDIRLVYDGSKSMLNSVVWAPNFYLPNIDTLLGSCTPKTWFADLDLGEMFLNYNLN